MVSSYTRVLTVVFYKNFSKPHSQRLNNKVSILSSEQEQMTATYQILFYLGNANIKVCNVRQIKVALHL